MRPSKLIGVLGASLGLLGTLSVTTCLVLADNGIINFTSDNVRSYHGEFYDDEVLLYETTLKRGEKIEVPEAPEKEGDEDGHFYTFVGWDTSGNGLPDVTPNYMYYNFTARAVYVNFKIPNLDDFNIDPSKIDWEKLLELMEKFNISLEDLLKFLNLSLDDLPQMIDFEFELDREWNLPYAPLFRTESEGIWSPKKKKWVGTDRFDGEKIGIGDYQPLNFFIDKLQDSSIQDLLSLAGIRTSQYLYDFDISYSKSFKNYPVPEYESNNINPAKSDAIPTVDVEDRKYTTSGYTIPYIPGLYNTIAKLPFNGSLKDKEEKYRKYAHDHYLDIPNEYKSFLKTELEDNNISFNPSSPDFSVVDKLGEYLGANYKFTMEQKSKSDPVIEINNTKIGSFEYLTTYEIFLLRSLGIPARMVHGYLCEVDGTHGIGDFKTSLMANAAEVYFDNLGWVVLNVVNCPFATPEENESQAGKDRDKFAGDQKDGSSNGGGAGDISNQLSAKGPGKKTGGGAGGPPVNGSIASVAKIKSPYNGTIYLKSQSYGDYNGEGWSNKEVGYKAPNNAKYSPQSFVYNNATFGGMFSKFSLSIEYLRNLNYGLVPEYTNNNRMDEYATESNKKEKDKNTYESVMVSLNKNNIKLLQANGNNAKNPAINDIRAYESYLNSKNKYLDLTSLQRAYLGSTEIAETLSEYRYYTSAEYTIAKLEAIKQYLSANYTYDLDYDYSSVGTYTDMMIPFMTVKKGICQQFATMATLLCRYGGIRARWVTGFATRSIKDKECYVNPDTCHAWTEVYIDGVGWMIWDCTPADMSYDRDVSKPQSETDEEYGKGPGGGGIQDTIETVKISLKLSNITKTYDSGKVTENNVGNVLYVGPRSDLPTAEFNEKYKIVVDHVLASGSEDPLYDYEARLYNMTADVYYKILEKSSNSDVTSKFYGTDGNLIANDDGFGVFTNVPVNIINATITITTDSVQGSEFELQNNNSSLITRVTSVTSESSETIIEVKNTSISEILYAVNNDNLLLNNFASLDTVGQCDASVNFVFYCEDKDGEYLDVTELYTVITDYGELRVG